MIISFSKLEFYDRINVIFNPLIVGAQELNLEHDSLFFSLKATKLHKERNHCDTLRSLRFEILKDQEIIFMKFGM